VSWLAAHVRQRRAPPRVGVPAALRPRRVWVGSVTPPDVNETPGWVAQHVRSRRAFRPPEVEVIPRPRRWAPVAPPTPVSRDLGWLASHVRRMRRPALEAAWTPPARRSPLPLLGVRVVPSSWIPSHIRRMRVWREDLHVPEPSVLPHRLLVKPAPALALPTLTPPWLEAHIRRMRLAVREPDEPITRPRRILVGTITYSDVGRPWLAVYVARRARQGARFAPPPHHVSVVVS